ncbi:hypothetical protein [Rhodanobacter sp. FW106-PBR-LB-2-11]|uniref:hypothetical protein n=1 Tax=Rhodanobacter sp. FW106-PBR-LB-2-11 TaxID=1524463 RepID=UPI0034E40BE4
MSQWVVLDWVGDHAREVARVDRWADADRVRQGMRGTLSIDSAESWDRYRGYDENDAAPAHTPTAAEAA